MKLLNKPEPPWRVEIIADWREALSDAFWAQWEEWYAAASVNHVFYSPALARAWIETYLELRKIRPFYLIAHTPEALVFLPLVIWHQGWKCGWRRLAVPVGHSDFDYHDPIVVAPPQASIDWLGYWAAVTRHVLNHSRACDEVLIDGIRPSSAPCEAPGIGHTEDCPFIPLAHLSSIDEYLATLDRGVRQDFLRRRRRFEKEFEVTYWLFASEDTPAAVAELERLLHHHSLRWPQAYKAPGLHANVLRRSLQAGIARFSCLRANGLSIAWHLKFADGRDVRSWMPAFDYGWRLHSPGSLLRYYEISSAIADRFLTFDFLRGTEAHKTDWGARESVPLYSLNRQRWASPRIALGKPATNLLRQFAGRVG